MLKQYEDQQAQLKAAQEAEERQRQNQQEQQAREFEQRQQEQAERERLAQEQLMQQQMMQMNSHAAQQVNDMQMEMLNLRNRVERDQLLLEQYDNVSAISVVPGVARC